MVTETVVLKVAQEDEKARKEAEEKAQREDFKQDRDHLKKYQ